MVIILRNHWLFPGCLSLWLSFWEIIWGSFLFDCSPRRKYTCRQVHYLFQINEGNSTIRNNHSRKHIRRFEIWGKNEATRSFFILIMLSGNLLCISSLFYCSAARDSQSDLHIILRCWVGQDTCFWATSMMTWSKNVRLYMFPDDTDICYGGQGWRSRSWEVVKAAKMW